MKDVALRIRRITVFCGLLLGFASWSVAGDQHCACQSCQAPDGCCFQNVVKYRCVMVPETKQIKKTVYECRDVPYCEHRLPKFGHFECCPECQACPKFKKVLVKREVVVSEVCVMKCVVEEYCDRVLGPCGRCGHVPQPDGDQVTPGVPPPPQPPAEPRSAWLPPAEVDGVDTVRR